MRITKNFLIPHPESVVVPHLRHAEAWRPEFHGTLAWLDDEGLVTDGDWINWRDTARGLTWWNYNQRTNGPAIQLYGGRKMLNQDTGMALRYTGLYMGQGFIGGLPEFTVTLAGYTDPVRAATYATSGTNYWLEASSDGTQQFRIFDQITTVNGVRQRQLGCYSTKKVGTTFPLVQNWSPPHPVDRVNPMPWVVQVIQQADGTRTLTANFLDEEQAADESGNNGSTNAMVKPDLSALSYTYIGWGGFGKIAFCHFLNRAATPAEVGRLRTWIAWRYTMPF